MASDTPSFPTRRAQAERNRAKILEAARAAFAEQDAEVSMAEISRRAGVGMATLYRNFPGRRELLEALYIDEIDALCDAAETIQADTPRAAFVAWLRVSWRSYTTSARSSLNCSSTPTTTIRSCTTTVPEHSMPAGRC